MSTPHTLLPLASYVVVADGPAIALAGRTRGTFTLTVSRLTTGATVTVILEASPTGEDGTWEQLASFGSVAARGVTTAPVPGWGTLTTRDRYVRGRVTAVSLGAAVLEVRAEIPFVDPVVDAPLFAKEFREWADGFARTIGEAEATVVRALTPEPGYDLDADPSLPGFGTAMRVAIVRQAEHQFQRHLLFQRQDPASVVSYRQWPTLAPNLLTSLSRFRRTTSTVWRGR